MNQEEAILIELRKISAFAELQRKWMKYSIYFAAGILILMIVAILLVEIWAESLATKAIPEPDPTWHDVTRAILHGNFETAIETGEQLLIKTPDYPHAHTTLAEAYLASGNLRDCSWGGAPGWYGMRLWRWMPTPRMSCTRSPRHNENCCLR